MLYGKTLGVIGMGNIGRQVAQRARGFGMRVLYHDVRRLDPADESQFGVTYAELDGVLAVADFVTLHLHLNSSTTGTIGARELDLLKPDCVIVNVSRAQLIDLHALAPRLAGGRLRGAAFDVFEVEPTTGREPYLSLPNVVATPHIAGSTVDTYRMAMTNCVDNIKRALAGQRPLWVVNN